MGPRAVREEEVKEERGAGLRIENELQSIDHFLRPIYRNEPGLCSQEIPKISLEPTLQKRLNTQYSPFLSDPL